MTIWSHAHDSITLKRENQVRKERKRPCSVIMSNLAHQDNLLKLMTFFSLFTCLLATVKRNELLIILWITLCSISYTKKRWPAQQDRFTSHGSSGKPYFQRALISKQHTFAKNNQSVLTISMIQIRLFSNPLRVVVQLSWRFFRSCWIKA